ncbi:MAG: galactokinase [Tepidisphaeraceae bacterium]|jgi:galactokinase
MQQDEMQQFKDRFTQLFGPSPRIRVVRAPGRVNLIGEHTDYNDGFVFPMAIEPEIRVICRSRKDEIVKIASTVYSNEFAEFSLQKKIERGKPTWGNYARGVAAELIAAGIPLCGMDALIGNSLPVGGGLSSSAAIEVSIARALLLLSGLEIEPNRLALICQKAEHEYAQVPCGIMDQMIVTAARAGHAMMLDCRDLHKQFVPLEEKELRVVIVNSMVRHELGDSEYAMRRKQCEEGVAVLKRDHPEIKALRDVTMEQVEVAKDRMSEVVYRRCRHVVSENLRTIQMAQKLLLQRYDDAGELMVKSHKSLRDDYEVSCAELDFLVEEALKIKGVYGARMTGGGFGGSIVALVQPRSVEALSEHVHKTYTAKFDRQPSVFVTTATAGASVLE